MAQCRSRLGHVAVWPAARRAIAADGEDDAAADKTAETAPHRPADRGDADDDGRKQLATSFLSAVVARYRGTVLGRPELEGELIEDLPGALWARDMFRRWTGGTIGRVVVAVDPPATSNAQSDGCGIIVAGRIEPGAVVLRGLTLQPAAPLQWAARAVEAFHAHRADCIVAEANQGGDMVRAVLAQVDADVPVRLVHATRGKWISAEPGGACSRAGPARRRDVQLRG